MEKMIKTLKQLEAEGVKFAVIKIDETLHWKDNIAKKAKKIFGVYLIDLTQPTNLCSPEINFPAQALKNFFTKIKGFNEDELTQLELHEGIDGEWRYYLENSSFEVAKEYRVGEYEDVMEYERGNPTVC